LNDGLLPPEYEAGIQQQEGWQIGSGREPGQSELQTYTLKRRTIVIRHSSGDDVVALIELVSPGNKSATNAFKSFVEKAVETLYRGYHLLIVDLFPPGRRDPNGIHAAIWGEITDDPVILPPDEPLTLAAYSAGQRKKVYVEPTRSVAL
jgi:hypothetical protein